MQTLDFAKPVQTRDGRAVTIYCTDVPGKYPIHGRIEGRASPACWSASGEYCIGSMFVCDLVNVPEPEEIAEGYVNIYPDRPYPPRTVLHTDRRDADAHAGGNRIACVKVVIPFRKGQFDE